MKTGIITTDTYLNHHTGEGHPERPDRVTAVIEHLKKVKSKNLIWKNLNKKEKALAKLEHLKHSKLRSEMFRLNITTTPDRFLDWLDDMKKQKGINNFWKEEQYKEWREDIKKHPEKVIRMT